MKKDLPLYLFLAVAIIALYISTKTYKNFSLDKSISACIYAQLKKNKEMKMSEAERFCEAEIKVKKN